MQARPHRLVWRRRRRAVRRADPDSGRRHRHAHRRADGPHDGFVIWVPGQSVQGDELGLDASSDAGPWAEQRSQIAALLWNETVAKMLVEA